MLSKSNLFFSKFDLPLRISK